MTTTQLKSYQQSIPGCSCWRRQITSLLADGDGLNHDGGQRTIIPVALDVVDGHDNVHARGNFAEHCRQDVDKEKREEAFNFEDEIVTDFMRVNSVPDRECVRRECFKSRGRGYVSIDQMVVIYFVCTWMLTRGRFIKEV